MRIRIKRKGKQMNAVDIIVLVITSACTLLLIGVGVTDVVKDFKRFTK